MDMLTQKRTIQHSLSTLSLESSSTINEDAADITLPSPSNLTECNAELDKYQSEIEITTNELNIHSQNVKELRRQKEPFMKIKDVLQAEIAQSNEIINMKSEEVTQLKNKLRHHSEKQIQNNIERLEYQLRINNYKPKEEQKILDEISMLQRSYKTLKEYNLKELENRKYRAERNRLIEQRNEIYSNIRVVYGREEKEKREVKKMRRKVAETTKIVDHLLNCRSNFEQARQEEKRQKDELVKKKLEEKARSKKDQYFKRQEERRKLWEEYEASREPYEEEKSKCKVLIAYMEKLLPVGDKASSNGTDTIDGPRVTLTRSQTAPPRGTCEDRLMSLQSTPLLQKLDGTFYNKQKDEELTTNRRLSKKEKAKAKKELRVNKSKIISHPPEVLADLLKLNIPIPRNNGSIPLVLASLKSTLESYYNMGKPRLVEPTSPKVVLSVDTSSPKIDAVANPAEASTPKIDPAASSTEASTPKIANDRSCSNFIFPATNSETKHSITIPVVMSEFAQMNGTSSDVDSEAVGYSRENSISSAVLSGATETVVLNDSNFTDVAINTMPTATASVVM